jgi:hypothetical protein
MSKLTLAEAQAQRVVIGLKDVAGPKGVRRDIDDLLLNDADAFNLFALALWDLQNEGESSNPMCYFQLSGLRRHPKVPATANTARYPWHAENALGQCRHQDQKQKGHGQQWLLRSWHSELWSLASPISGHIRSTSCLDDPVHEKC